jgi:hypothetical protein
MSMASPIRIVTLKPATLTVVSVYEPRVSWLLSVVSLFGAVVKVAREDSAAVA